MSKFEQALRQGDKQTGEAKGGEQPATHPLTAGDNKTLLDSRPKDIPQGFATPTIHDSSNLHPQGALSPEGPPAKLFDGLGANGVRTENGVSYYTKLDPDGTQRRTIRDPAANTSLEDVSHPDGTTELIKSQSNYRETDKFEADGKRRSYELIDETTNRADKNKNVVVNREYDHGKPIMDNNRWQDPKGEWHENNWMKTSDNSTYSVVMNGNVTTKRMVKENGSWWQSVQDRDRNTNDYTDSDHPAKK